MVLLLEIKSSSLSHKIRSPLKVGLSPSKKIILFASIKTFQKGSILKTLFVLKIFLFVLTFWTCRKTLVSKFMKSQPGQETITINKLSNISQTEGNQAMKIGQLLEYN